MFKEASLGGNNEKKLGKTNIDDLQLETLRDTPGAEHLGVLFIARGRSTMEKPGASSESGLERT